MTQQHNQKDQKIQDFIAELTGFAATAEATLSEIEKDLEGNKGKFTVFQERMFAIRGTARQLNLPHVAHIAGLAEELAVKGTTASSRAHVRKCVGCLWDALTTVKYLLVNYTIETGEEQAILIHRLESTLKALGGARETVAEDEIEALLRAQRKS
jgi:hypothetical protein